MLWLLKAPRRLKRLGILSMNRRNAACILDHNPRARFPIVDDKLRMRDLCARIGVPTPAVYGVIAYHSLLRRLRQLLGDLADFVIKPSHGAGGRGVLVIVGRRRDHYLRHNGEPLRLDQVRQHLSDILSGMYSLGAHPDQALLQQRVRLHRAFEPVSCQGIPDVRVILYRKQPAMAMLRLPTRASGGRANLHQGGIGAGVDLDTGLTRHAVLRNRVVDTHPDTGQSVVGRRVPYWQEILEMSRRVAEAVGLGYLGVDIVVDAAAGPLLLEANARPGLAIQTANGVGLVSCLDRIDAALSEPARPPGAPPSGPSILARIGAKLRRAA
jgi:alpha-L-glutamate ligase-like protein